MHLASLIGSLLRRGNRSQSLVKNRSESGFHRTPIFALATLLCSIVPASVAQRSAPVPAHTALLHPNSGVPSFAMGRGVNSFPRLRHSNLGSGFLTAFGDVYDLESLYSSGYPVNSQPPVVLLQAARDMAGSSNFSAQSFSAQSEENSEKRTAQPLMIELQGGRYVRVANSAADGEALPLSFSSGSMGMNDSKPPALPGSSARKVKPDASLLKSTIDDARLLPDLLPVILIFRNGAREEVRDYAISDGALYARGDFYRDGYWNKKIELSTLDIAQTFQTNAGRNVKFVLPSSPNEIVTRP